MARDGAALHWGQVVSYADDELRTVLSFAASVYIDPDASPADRDAARRRILRNDSKPDFNRLSTSELVTWDNAMRTVMALTAYARGEPYKAPELIADVLVPGATLTLTEPANASTSAATVVTESAAPIAPTYTLADLALGKHRSLLARR